MRKPRDFGVKSKVYRKRRFLEQYLNAGYAPKYLVTAFSEIERGPEREIGKEEGEVLPGREGCW
jgi:hypothetical protein